MAGIESRDMTGRSPAGYLATIAGVAALGGFLFGYDTAVINGAVVALQQHFNAGSMAVGLAVSLALLGSAVGAFFAGPLADRIGRVPCMKIAAGMFLVSAIGSGFPFSLHDFIFWRLLGGVGVGAASVLAPAYIAEISPAAMRGRLGSLQQLAIVTGIFVALLGNYGIASVAGSAAAPFWLGYEAWRWMFWSEVPAALLYGLAACFIPESPRYLVAVGRVEEAVPILGRVLGLDDARGKAEEIRLSLMAEHKPRLSDLVQHGRLLPIVWVGIILSMLQQFVGINVIFYYSSALWQSVGLDESKALFVTMITGITNIVTTVIAIAWVDKIGRRPLLLMGSAGMALSLGVLSVVFGAAGLGPEGTPLLTVVEGRVALVAANVFVFFFGFSWGPVVWVLLGEMFPNRIRAAALAVGAGAQWIANFAVSTTFPPMSTHLGLGISYSVYTLAAIVSFVFVYALVRETKGRELEDMK